MPIVNVKRVSHIAGSRDIREEPPHVRAQHAPLALDPERLGDLLQRR